MLRSLSKIYVLAFLCLFPIVTTDSYAQHSLYYPIVDSNNSTWVGIAISNPNQLEARLQISLYESSGRLLSSRSLNLGANQQTAFLVDDFFKISGEISGWVEVQSDVNIVGFEVWGSKLSGVMAGLQAASFPAQSLYLPHIASGSGWETFVSVINVSQNPGNVVLTAYDKNSTEIKSIAKTLSSKQQLKVNVRELFLVDQQMGGI